MTTSKTEQDTAALDCENKPFDIAGASNVGKRRPRNEDRYLIADLKRLLSIRSSNVPHEQCQQICSDRNGQLLVVADGMGGHRDGDVASTMAVESIARYVLDMLHWFLKLNEDHEDDFQDDLSNCLRSIQQRLWSKSGSQTARMGTTVTMAYLLWPRLYVVHAGDSRCYVVKEQRLRQVTTDHTLAQQMVESGAFSDADAKRSAWRNILWNCVGGGDKVVKPEVTRIALDETDQLLICSDGLTDMVDDRSIELIMNSSQTADDAVQRLIAAANDAGGSDNITTIVGRFASDNSASGDGDGFGTTLRDTDLNPLAK